MIMSIALLVNFNLFCFAFFFFSGEKDLLESMGRFCYFGTIVTAIFSLDKQFNTQIRKAAAIFDIIMKEHRTTKD